MVNYLDYIKRVQKNNYLEWDVKTITAGDFSIEFDLVPGFFSDFLANYRDQFSAEFTEMTGRHFDSDVQCF